MTSVNGASAFNPSVRTNEPDHVTHAARVQRAADMADAVKQIEAKLAGFEDVDLDGLDRNQVKAITKQKAALRDALEAAREQADQAGAEAQEGSR